MCVCMYMNMLIYIYIYEYELYVLENCELIGSTDIIWKQVIFYFEQISLHKLFPV